MSIIQPIFIEIKKKIYGIPKMFLTYFIFKDKLLIWILSKARNPMVLQ